MTGKKPGAQHSNKPICHHEPGGKPIDEEYCFGKPSTNKTQVQSVVVAGVHEILDRLREENDHHGGDVLEDPVDVIFFGIFDFIEVIKVLWPWWHRLWEREQQAHASKSAKLKNLKRTFLPTQRQGRIQLNAGRKETFPKVTLPLLQQLLGGKSTLPARDKGQGTLGLEAIPSTGFEAETKAENHGHKIERLAILQECRDGDGVKKGSANMLKAEMANLNLEAMKSLDARRQHHGKPRLPWRNGPSSLQQS